MEQNKDINSNFFDLYEFFYSIVNKWYLYLPLLVFFLNFVLTTEIKYKYKIKVSPAYGPKVFVFKKLIDSEKSINIDLQNEKLIYFINNKLNLDYIDSFEIRNLINDIKYLKNINSKEKINFDLTSIRLPLFDHKYYEEFFAKKISRNSYLKENYNIKIGKNRNHTILVTSLVKKSNKEKLEAIYNEWIKEIYDNYENSQELEFVTFPRKDNWIELIDINESEGIINIFETNIENSLFFVRIFLLLIIVNLIINFFDKKVYSISRVSNYLDFKINLIINYRNLKELSFKLSKLKESDKNSKLYFLASKNTYNILINKIPLFNKNQLLNIDEISKDLLKVEDSNFITGHAVNSSFELIEINSIFKTYLDPNNLKVIYISRFIHNL